MKRRKSNIDEYNDSWAVIYCIRFSDKDKPVRVISNSYQQNVFTIGKARDRSYCCPGWFLNENDIKVVVNFEDCVNDEIIFLDVL